MAIPVALSEFVTDEELDALFQRVDTNGTEVDAVVELLVNEYCAPVDEVIKKIDTLLRDTQDVPDPVLDLWVMRLPAKLYFASTAAESLGVRDDIAQLLYKEAFNKARQTASGTVADKNTIASLHTNAEALAAVVYKRASRTVKTKLDTAYEMLAALKKVVSHRIADKSIANADPGKERA